MELGNDVADDLRRLLVPAGARQHDERPATLGTLEKKRIAILVEDAHGALAVPPGEQHVAAFGIRMGCDAEHGRLVRLPHRQQPRRARHDLVAVRNKAPAAEIGVEQSRVRSVACRSSVLDQRTVAVC